MVVSDGAEENMYTYTRTNNAHTNTHVNDNANNISNINIFYCC